MRNERSWPTYKPCPHPDERWPASGWLLIPPDLRRMMYGRSRRSQIKASRRVLIVTRETRRDAQWLDLPGGMYDLTAGEWQPPAGRITEATSTFTDLDGSVIVNTEITLHGRRDVIGYTCVTPRHLPEAFHDRMKAEVSREARRRAGLDPSWTPPRTPPRTGVKVAHVTRDRL